MYNILYNERIKRTALDMEAKRRILTLVDNGFSHKSIANQFNIGRSTVTKIALNRKKILENDLGAPSNSIRRIREGKLGILKNRLVKWCIGEDVLFQPGDLNAINYNTLKTSSCIEIRKGITSDHIITKAQEIAKELGIEKVRFTNSWVNRFKDKFNLNIDINWKKPGPLNRSLDSDFNEFKNHSLKNTCKNIVVPSNFNENFFYPHIKLDVHESCSIRNANTMNVKNFNQNELYFQSNYFNSAILANGYNFESNYSNNYNNLFNPFQSLYFTDSKYFNYPFYY